jgi:hypothetical protein
MSVVDAAYPRENFSQLGCTRPEMEFEAGADSGLLLPVSLVRGKADLPVAKIFGFEEDSSTDKEAWGNIRVLHFHIFSVRGSHIRFELPSTSFSSSLLDAALSSDQYRLFTASQFLKVSFTPSLFTCCNFPVQDSIISAFERPLCFTSRDTALQPPTLALKSLFTRQQEEYVIAT